MKEKSSGPWLLVMDNCGGYKVEADLPDVRIITLPLRCTAKRQTLDIDVIVNKKIRYRSSLPRATIATI